MERARSTPRSRRHLGRREKEKKPRLIASPQLTTSPDHSDSAQALGRQALACGTGPAPDYEAPGERRSFAKRSPRPATPLTIPLRSWHGDAVTLLCLKGYIFSVVPPKSGQALSASGAEQVQVPHDECRCKSLNKLGPPIARCTRPSQPSFHKRGIPSAL